MKVNQAKQRLGPRIQAEAASVTEVTCLVFIKVYFEFDNECRIHGS